MSKEKQDINWQIRAIELLDYSLSYPSENLGDTLTYQFDVNIEHKLKIEDNLLLVITSINIYHNGKKTSLGQFKSSCVFSIENLNSFIEEKSGHLNLPEQFITTLNSVSISTTRGLMFSQFRGTFLHNAILPIVDPTKFKAHKN
jgi:hypothetical protein